MCLVKIFVFLGKRRLYVIVFIFEMLEFFWVRFEGKIDVFNERG